MEPIEKIFSIATEGEFIATAINTFQHQYEQNLVYRNYTDSLGIKPAGVRTLTDIPFLPIEFFRTHDVICGTSLPQAVFRSSGTTSAERSRHMVTDLRVYRGAFVRGFEYFYGPAADFQFLALAPTPEQAPDSSLVFMIRHLMDLSTSPENGYFMGGHAALIARLRQRRAKGRQIMLIGLSYALLDFAMNNSGDYSPLIVTETGGMKGQRREITREELHETLCPALGVDQIHSEYGMTELLSQAWSQGQGLFRTPPWMRVILRDTTDPFGWAPVGTTGGINIIDLANRNSCSFIATQDLGRMHSDGRFEVLGRFDAADARGCSLLI